MRRELLVAGLASLIALPLGLGCGEDREIERDLPPVSAREPDADVDRAERGAADRAALTRYDERIQTARSRTDELEAGSEERQKISSELDRVEKQLERARQQSADEGREQIRQIEASLAQVEQELARATRP